MNAPTVPIRILGIAGSLREASHNRRLVRLAAAAASGMAGEVGLVEFNALGQVEPFDEDLEAEGMPPGAAALRQAIVEADAVLIATPEYNGSIPGQLKNALDWASRSEAAPHHAIAKSPLYGMPTAVISASTGQFGAVWARDELLKVLHTQGARVVPEPKVALAAAHEAFDEDGALLHAPTAQRLGDVVGAIVEQVRTVRAAPAATA